MVFMVRPIERIYYTLKVRVWEIDGNTRTHRVDSCGTFILGSLKALEGLAVFCETFS